jgi:methionyl-tRNA formyltransferase
MLLRMISSINFTVNFISLAIMALSARQSLSFAITNPVRCRQWTSATILSTRLSRTHWCIPSNTHTHYTLALFSTNNNNDNNYDITNDTTPRKQRIVFLGTPQVAATTLQTLYQASQQPESIFEIVGVVTQPPKRRKRKGTTEPTPVGLVAASLGLPHILTPDSAKDDTFLTTLERDIRPDVCITAAYGQYLPQRFLAIPPCGTVNIHPSLLPRWRGASPVQRSLQAGDNPVGVTVLFTVRHMDAGPIIAQQPHTIDENDTATTVLPLLFHIGTQLLLDALPGILEGRMTLATATPQDDAAAVPARRIDAAEGECQVWKESALTCHNKLRGFSMWPGAYMYIQVGDRQVMKLKLLETRVLPETTTELTRVLVAGPDKKDGLRVVCYDGSILELLVVQPATRNAFPARDLQNGYPGETIQWVETPMDVDSHADKYNSRNATHVSNTTSVPTS